MKNNSEISNDYYLRKYYTKIKNILPNNYKTKFTYEIFVNWLYSLQ
jgi:hypothetical protein